MQSEHEAEDWFSGANEDRLGDFGEMFWSKVLEASRMYYMPLSKITTGGSPKLGGTKHALPDFDVASDRIRVFIDSKCKKNSVVYRKAGNQERHGINKSAYVNYQGVSLKVRQKCGLAVFECFTPGLDVWSGSMLVQGLDVLGSPFWGDPATSQKHMCYWKRSAFSQVGHVSALQAWRIAHGREQAFDIRDQLEWLFTAAGRKQKALW